MADEPQLHRTACDDQRVAGRVERAKSRETVGIYPLSRRTKEEDKESGEVGVTGGVIGTAVLRTRMAGGVGAGS